MDESSASNIQQRIQELKEIASVLIEKKEYEEAIPYFDELKKLAPQDDWVWLESSKAKHGLGLNEESRRDLNEVIKLNSAEQASIIPVKKTERYISQVPSAPQIDANTRKQVLLSEGAEQREKGFFLVALECFDKALQIDPNYKDALNNKGLILWYIRKYAEALECFNKSLRIEGENKFVLQCISEIKATMDAPRNPLPLYQLPVILLPTSTLLKNASIFIEQKKYAEAHQCYNRALEIDAHSEEAWQQKGDLFKEEGNQEDAYTCYQALRHSLYHEGPSYILSLYRSKWEIKPLVDVSEKPPTSSVNTSESTTVSSQGAPSAPQMGTQTLQNLAPSAPSMSEQTQQFLVQRNQVRNDNYDEIILDNNQVIAKGGFGVVYRAQWNQTIVAVKTNNNFEQLDSIKKEYDMLRELQHPNLVHIHGCFTRNKIGFCLVMDFYVNGSLNQYLYFPEIWLTSDTWRLRCSIEITQGLIFLHENNLLHLDLKPENVLVREDWHVVITDFGISRKLAMNQTHQTTASAMGTPAFTAPEIMAPKNTDGKTRYDRTNDIYSLGILLWCCATQKKPFSGWDNMRIMLKVTAKRNNREEIPEETPKGLAKLIKQCWAQTPASRPSATNVQVELNELYVKKTNKNSFPLRK
jgi:tetratricopeptide (TPR) repeat protein